MKLIALTAAALLTACAPAPGMGPMRPEPPSGGPAGPDQCGAGGLQHLVGRSHAQIPPEQPGRTRRVYSTADAVTMDFSPQRLNIVYDARTHVIVRVFCG
jgi:hypothetical protein